ncbi:B3 domain-containing protein REM20-like [Cynara cardunculus var. scolymus]|uniref:B3 domain-containing protein REM20-like n=1 Tax=Cynara cardunculus var. scolymus TaxID=59895 RepID=UPI000D622F0F|nr:B3 domain-containing protein REM20-like [Cynara cardunculus var. scolymus]
MADCSPPPPSFFKILLDPSASHLPLPHAFVSKHKIPKNPTLQIATGGYSWRLTIERIGKAYCFGHGWKNVVEDAQLGFGDFLVFKLVHQSTFIVSVFAPNGCERFLPSSKIKVEDDVDVDVDVVDDDDDSNDGIVYEGGGDEDDDEEEEEEDNDDDDSEEEEEEEDDDDDSGSGGDGDGGDDDDDDGDGGIDGDDGDPFFMTIISKTHNNLLRLPSEFVELAGIGNQSTITLKNLDEHEWRLGIRSEKIARTARYHLSPGWQDFRRSNELSEGDECVFKYIKSEGKLSLVKITKKKPMARQSPVKIPATEVVKRKRGRPVVKVNAVARQPPAKTPAKKVVKRKRGRPFKNRRPVDVQSGDDCVEVVQRRPSKKSRVIYF